MNIHADIAKELYDDKHAAQMNYSGYLHYLEEGFEMLNKKEDLSGCRDLDSLKAIRIALQYRIEVLRKHRTLQPPL